MKAWMALTGLAGLMAIGCSTYDQGGAYDNFENEGRYKSWGYPGGQSDMTMPNNTGARQQGIGGGTSTPDTPDTQNRIGP